MLTPPGPRALSTPVRIPRHLHQPVPSSLMYSSVHGLEHLPWDPSVHLSIAGSHFRVLVLYFRTLRAGFSMPRVALECGCVRLRSRAARRPPKPSECSEGRTQSVFSAGGLRRSSRHSSNQQDFSYTKPWLSRMSFRHASQSIPLPAKGTDAVQPGGLPRIPRVSHSNPLYPQLLADALPDGILRSPPGLSSSQGSHFIPGFG